MSNSAICQRISRIYAAIGAIEEADPHKLNATVIQTGNVKAVFQDFRGGFSDDELSNQAHSVIHNIANLRDHLRRWAGQNGRDKAKVDQTIDNSLDLQIVQDLSNNDKHGYPPRDGGRSGKCPQLIEINRVMRLQIQAKKGSMIAMTIGAGGVPKFIGDGSAKAVVTGEVVDNAKNRIGDLYEIANKAVEAWERLLVDFGLITMSSGT
jgi:hypothetical protein